MKNKGREEALSYAFLLLKYRLRSKQELQDRLARKKFPGEIIEQVITTLEEKGFLNDTVFAKTWISSRTSQRFGARRIRQELRRKGVDPAVIDEGLREMKELSPEDETIRSVAEEKFRKLKDCDPQAAKRRIYAYFIRRGFSPDAVIDILNDLI